MSRTFDSRTIAEVEESRNRTNRKPYRSREQRAEAANHAFKNPRGHFTSRAPKRYHEPDSEEE